MSTYPMAQSWVYEEQGQVVGFISLVGNEVGGLFVHPAAQRKGIGSALMDKACRLYDRIELEVFSANATGVFW